MRNALIALVALVALALGGYHTTGGLRIGLVVGAVLAFIALAWFGYRWLETRNRA